jgi:hypothetical protein
LIVIAVVVEENKFLYALDGLPLFINVRERQLAKGNHIPISSLIQESGHLNPGIQVLSLRNFHYLFLNVIIRQV